LTRSTSVFLATLLLILYGASVHAASLEAHVATTTGTPVEDAAVVVEPSAGDMPIHHARTKIEQRDRELVPYVTIIQTGTAIDFPNRDAFKHHLFSFSPAKRFEIKLYAGKPVNPVVFDKPGEVALGCNIHDWMEAYVLVVDSPYFAKTDRKGRAIISNIPPGHYRLRLWHPREKSEPPQRAIEIAAAPEKLNLALDIAPRVVKPKPPVEADSY
jgi:plastocyanin